MPSNYTEHYQLNLWDADDQVQRVDFNADNAKVDAAIHAVAQKADSLSSGKAEQSALDAEVKARQSADSSLTTKINTINATLPKKGNCQIYTTTYVGDGAESRTLTFPGKPLFVFIVGNPFFLSAAYGTPKIMSTNGSGGSSGLATWTDTSLSWTFYTSGSSNDNCCNKKDVTYRVVVLMDAAG